MGKLDAVIVGVLGLSLFAGFVIGKSTYDNSSGTYTIQCAVITPSGPVPTISLKARDVSVTEFGIIKSKEGLYIPTTSEICVIKKETE